MCIYCGAQFEMTEGEIAYYYQGRFYSDYHSLAFTCARNLLQQACTDLRGFLKDRRRYVAKLAREFHEVFAIDPDDIHGMYHKTGALQLADEHELITPPTALSDTQPLFRALSFAIDLDREGLTVRHPWDTFYFRLSELPRDWANVIEVQYDMELQENDHPGVASIRLEEEIKPSVPFDRVLNFLKNHTTPISAPTPSQQLINTYHALSVTLVKPKDRSTLPHGSQSAVELPRQIHHRFLVSILYRTAEIRRRDQRDKLYRELVWLNLQLAVGVPEGLILAPATVVDDEEDFGNDFLVDWLEIPGEDEEEIEVIPPVLSNFHARGKGTWHFPSKALFWFHDVLVYMFADVHKLASTQAAIARLVKKGSADGFTSFHGLIISLNHVIMIKVYPDGRVDHTRLLALCPNWGRRICIHHFVKNGPADDIDDNKHSTQDPVLGRPAHRLRDIEETDTFAALAHFFNAAANEKLKPQTPLTAFPSEMFRMILDRADIATRLTCQKVSRDFRTWCQQTCIVDDEGSSVTMKKKDKLVLHGRRTLKATMAPVLGGERGNRVTITEGAGPMLVFQKPDRDIDDEGHQH